MASQAANKAPMGYTHNATTADVEILYNSAYVGRAITLDNTAFSNGVCPAGTPVDKDGKVANSASAVGILLKDVYINRPQGTAVYQGAIWLAVAEKHSGLTYAEAMKTALKNVVFM